MHEPGDEVASHERQVVGAVLLDPRIIDDVTDIITSGDFYDPRLAEVFSAACALREQGAPVDPVAVSDRLRRDGWLDRVGGMSAVADLAGTAVVAASGPWHAQRVRDAAVLRAVRNAGTRLHDLAAQAVASEDEALAVVDAARTELDAIATSRTDEDVGHAQAVWDSLEALKAPPGDPTPWPSITKAIAGWKPGALYLFGARPATGKSIAGVMATVDMARRGKTAMLFSLEMSRMEVYHRMLVSASEVDMQRLQTRRLTPEDDARLRRAAEDIAQLPMVVSDRPGLSVAQVRAQVRAAQRRRPVGLVVVDYLGLLSPPSDASRQNRSTQVDMIAQGLKNLAMELRVPVVAMAQLNRGPTGVQARRPQLSDLRESGGQEQAADVVFLMHRDMEEDEGTTLEVMLGKNRHGPQSRFEFSFQGHYSRFGVEDTAQPWSAR